MICYKLIVIIIVMILFSSLYHYVFSQKPRIHCKEGEFKNFIRQNVPIINEKYWPTMWCFEARFQSVLASLIRSFVVPPAPYIRYVHHIHSLYCYIKYFIFTYSSVFIMYNC